MATVLRHPVPTDSYDPTRPLNDLVGVQFQHFVEVAKRLPPELQMEMPVPPAEDTAAVARFMAAVTERLMTVKRAPLKLATKRVRKPKPPALALAAHAEPAVPRAGGKEAKEGSNFRLRRSGR